MGGTMISAMGQAAAGTSAYNNAILQGDTIKSETREEAKRIREAVRTQRSEARAGYAASGVDVNSGSAEAVDTDIARKGELDALMTILGGERQARLLKRQGKAMRSAANMNALGTVLGGASSSGWQGSGGGGGGGGTG